MRNFVITLGLFRFHWKPNFPPFFFGRKCTFPFEIVNLMSKIPHFIDKTFEPAVVTHSAGDTYSWNVSPELPSPWQDSSVPETGPTIRSQSRVMVQRVTGSFIYRRDREILLGSVCWSSSQITPCVVGSSWVLVGSKWRSAGEKIPDLPLHLLGVAASFACQAVHRGKRASPKRFHPLGWLLVDPAAL